MHVSAFGTVDSNLVKIQTKESLTLICEAFFVT